MAEIPIEKKRGGGAWWLWALIAAIVLALLLWLFLGNDDDRNAVQPATTTAAITAPVNPDANAAGYANADANQTGAITDLQTLGNGQDASLVGRNVQLTNVPVGDVSGDANFWITGENGQRYYVVLNEVRTPNTPIEGRVDINKGDRVDVTGTIRSASNGAPEGAAAGTKTDPIPAGVNQYIYAQSANVRS